jgi:hypothetical protein
VDPFLATLGTDAMSFPEKMIFQLMSHDFPMLQDAIRLSMHKENLSP